MGQFKKQIIFNILLYTLLIVVGLASILYITGFLYPVLTYQIRIVVNSPVEECYKIYSDTAQRKNWVSNLKSVDLVEAENEKHLKYELVMEENGSQYTINETIKARSANDFIVTMTESDFTAQSTLTIFEATGNHTLITSANELKGKNIFLSAFCQLMRKKYISKTRNQLEGFREYITGGQLLN